MKKTALFLLSLFCFYSSFAQKQVITELLINVEFIKDNFKDRKPEFKAALEEFEKGDYELPAGTGGFKRALPHYLKANAFNPNNGLLNYKIGKCYLFGSSYKLKSISYLEKAFKLKSDVDKEIFYILAQAYQINSEWDKAVEYYKKFESVLLPADIPLFKETIAKKKEECKTGKELTAKPVRVFIDNIGTSINTQYPEYGAIISADESVMIFTSRRPGGTGGKIDEFINEPFEDLYISYRLNNQWSTAQNMGETVNDDGHDAAINLSPDGMTLLVYQDDKGDGNIYQSKLIGDLWSKPKKLGKNINTKEKETSASFSYDGKTLYFISAREGGLGGLDIWTSQWDDKKEDWMPPMNLGPTINTKYDEEAVFIHPDGKTFYFSSRGHNTMGGYDIFKTVFQSGKWSKPENIGSPINTPDDDAFFVISASGRRGYYASFKPDGHGEKDVYVITFLGPEKPALLNTEDNLLASIAAPVKEMTIEPAVEVSKTKLTILKGFFKDAETLQPLEVSIELLNNEDGTMVLTTTSNSKTGKFLVSLPSGKNYGLAAKAEGYMFHSENFILPESAAYKEVTKEILMKKIKVGTVIILNNIFFDYGKYTLRSESFFELDRVLKVMTENPSIKVEISGHTDSDGSDALNQKLSENRAKAVVDFLLGKGVSKERLTFAGYGEAQPVAKNDTDENKQLNRRTEFKITGK